jgi:hypothetical protein
MQLLPERREVVQPCKNCVVLESHKRLYVAAVTKYRCVHDQNPVVKIFRWFIPAVYVQHCLVENIGR